MITATIKGSIEEARAECERRQIFAVDFEPSFLTHTKCKVQEIHLRQLIAWFCEVPMITDPPWPVGTLLFYSTASSNDKEI